MFSEKIVRIFISLLLISSFGCLGADNGFSCPSPKNDSAWWIPTEGFTQKEAKEALKQLNALVESGAAGRDFIEIENYLIQIRGYMYKEFLKSHKKEFGTDDSALRKEFCKFLQTQAFYRH